MMLLSRLPFDEMIPLSRSHFQRELISAAIFSHFHYGFARPLPIPFSDLRDITHIYPATLTNYQEGGESAQREILQLGCVDFKMMIIVIVTARAIKNNLTRINAFSLP
jgi:hypothetical protein